MFFQNFAHVWPRSGVSHLLLHCNSVANPLIYCYRNRPFRNAVLGLLNIRKPQEIQPNVRFQREKNPSGSLEKVIDLQVHEGQRKRLTRSASFNTALTLESAQVKQHSSELKTTALIHCESIARSRTKKSYHKRRVSSLS